MAGILTGGLGGPFLLTGGLGAVSVPVITGTVPDPDETAWTLTVGGVVTTPMVAAGHDYEIATVLLNAGAVVPYTSGDTLSAVVWTGQGAGALFHPTVAWIDAPSGSLTLAIAAGQTSGLDPGEYRMQLSVTSGGATSLAYDGTLTVLEVPGTITSRVPYVTAKDLLFWYPQLTELIRMRDDNTGFLQQRVNASDQFDRDLIVRYDPQPGFVRIRQNTLNSVVGMDVAMPTAVAPSKQALTVAIQAGGVIVDRNVNEMVARCAIADVLDRQETIGSNPFRQEAQAMRDRVEMLWGTFQVQVDTSSPLDGTADLLIDRGVTLLPTGTAP